MIRDITIGQYYPAESVIHRLDPRVKLVGTLTFIISLFLHRSFLMYLVAAVFLTSMMFKACKVPFPLYDKRFKGDHGTTSDHRGLRYVPHAGNAAYQDLEADPYGGRCKTGRFYGDPAGIC